MSEEIVSGRAAAGYRHFRHREIKAAAAMADVEHHAALLGGERRRQQLAVLHDVGEGAGDVRRAGIGVGQHVARPHQVEDLRHQLLGLDAADMHHHLGRPAAHLAGLDAALQRLQAVLGDHVLRHPHLDAEQEIRIFRQRHGAGFDLRVVDVVELGDREAGQAVIGDMDEGINPGARLRHDVAAQGREIVDAGVARRNHRGGALKLRQFVGGNADRGAVGIDVASAGRSGRASPVCPRRRWSWRRGQPESRPRSPRSCPSECRCRVFPAATGWGRARRRP